MQFVYIFFYKMLFAYSFIGDYIYNPHQLLLMSYPTAEKIMLQCWNYQLHFVLRAGYSELSI